MAKRKSADEGGGTAVAEQPKRGRGRPPKNAPTAPSNGHAAASGAEEADEADKPRRGRKQQDLIPDAFERIPEIEDASELLHAKRTRRIKLQAEEDEAQTRLGEIMLKHSREVYTYKVGKVNKTAIRNHSEKTTVKIKTDDEANSGD